MGPRLAGICCENLVRFLVRYRKRLRVATITQYISIGILHQSWLVIVVNAGANTLRVAISQLGFKYGLGLRCRFGCRISCKLKLASFPGNEPNLKQPFHCVSLICSYMRTFPPKANLNLGGEMAWYDQFSFFIVTRRKLGGVLGATTKSVHIILPFSEYFT